MNEEAARLMLERLNEQASLLREIRFALYVLVLVGSVIAYRLS